MLNSSEKQKKHPRQPFSQEEDSKLAQLVQSYSQKDINWEEISSQMENRNIRQCKERWEKYLNPNLSVDPWTQEEDEIITNMHLEFGPKWTLMANILENRTDIMVRNRWNVIYRRALKNKRKKNKTDQNKVIKTRKKRISKKEIKPIENKNDEKVLTKKEDLEDKNSSNDLLQDSIDQLDLSIFDQLVRTNELYDFDVFL